MKHSTNRNQTQFWVLKIKKKGMMIFKKGCGILAHKANDS